jgi:hypothetical protein
MQLLTKRGSIHDAIADTKPSHVATAYVGLGWKSYVDSSALEEIVLSPTLGSNPVAILELIALLGIEKVHFLNDLHAKFYWSSRGAVLGSSNLSDNGLQGDGGLIEAAVSIQDPDQRQALKAFHAELVAEAQERYPSAAAKHKQLKKLELDTRRARAVGLLSSGGFGRRKPIPFSKFDLDGQRRIHIVSYMDTVEADSENIRAWLPGRTDEEYVVLEENIVGFLPGDEVVPGDWLLCFEMKGGAKNPRVKGSFEWMFVDEVVPKGTTDDVYTKAALQGHALKAWEAPFDLDARFQASFSELIKEKQYCVFFDPIDRPWDLAVSDAKVPQFLAELQEVLTSSKRR